jgi:hypothetical protein
MNGQLDSAATRPDTLEGPPKAETHPDGPMPAAHGQRIAGIRGGYAQRLRVRPELDALQRLPEVTVGLVLWPAHRNV